MKIFACLLLLVACGDDSTSEGVDATLPTDAASAVDGSPLLDGAPPVDAPPDAPADAAPDAAPVNRSSLHFDGVDDRIVVPGTSSLSDLTAVTIELWIRPSAAGTPRYLIAKNRSGPSSQYSLEMQSNGTHEMFVAGANSGCVAPGGSSTFVPDVWMHVAGTWSAASGGNPRLYIDGQLADTSACSTSMATALNDLVIGAGVENSTVKNFFVGNIDEVRVWNVARTQAQIQAARNQLLTGTEANLVGYWSFEEGSGDTVIDATANHNNGRLGTGTGADAGDPTWSTSVPF